MSASLYFSSSPTYFIQASGSVSVPSKDHDGSNMKVFHVAPEIPWKLKELDTILLVPAVPAQDITTKDLIECKISTPSLPSILYQPLLKHSSQSELIQGYHSGRRSALVCVDGEWFRLKGCGDVVDGIIARAVEDGTGKFSEIRGVQFENTTTREICINT